MQAHTPAWLIAAPVAWLLLALPGSALAEPASSSGSKPLSEILAAVEQQHPGVVAEVEWEHGTWEIRTCTADACLKLYMDAFSGQEQRRKSKGSRELPPAGTRPASEIAASFEAAGLGQLTELEYKKGAWKAELRLRP